MSLGWVGCGCTGSVCSRETHSPSRASKIYGHKAFQITHLHTTVINSGRATQLTTTHTVGLRWGAIATIMADVSVTHRLRNDLGYVEWDVKLHIPPIPSAAQPTQRLLVSCLAYPFILSMTCNIRSCHTLG